jgi:hypothetical protein
MKKGSQLMCLETTGGLRVWDLCLFTKCSLAAACKSYQVPEELWKTSFKHDKIKSYEDAFEHEEECKTYCEQDIKALEAVYAQFAGKMWSLFSINVTKCITLSQFAFEYWRSTLQDEKIVLPTESDYRFIRRGLFGGRCGPQYTHYISDEYERLMTQYHQNGRINQTDIDELEDCTVMLDVVSLYPSQMKFGVYPLGAYSWLLQEECDALVNSINHVSTNEDFIGFAEVDVVCPKQLITSFLMSRGDNNSLDQNLCDKYNQVYPSTELYEAVRLGYVVTKVHRAIRFGTLGNPFVSFIDKIFALKQAAAVEPKDPVQYEIAKLMMNSLSGKMSQHVIEEEWHIITEDKFAKETEGKEVNVTEPLEDEEGNLLAYAALIVKDEVKVTKPLQLGCFILSQARVLMSKCLSHIGRAAGNQLGGYNLPNAAYYYQDTDSGIWQRSQVEDAKQRFPQLFGGDLGQLEDDLKGGKIIRANFLAPKTYCLEYVKGGQLFVKVRCKGVPHTKDIIAVQPECNGDIELRSSRAKYYLIDRFGKYEVDPYEHNKIKARRHLDCEAFHNVQFNNFKVLAEYTQFKKLYFSKAPSKIADIRIYEANRHLSRHLWWSKGKRSVMDWMTGFSLPLGHIDYPVAEVPQQLELVNDEEQVFVDD